MGCRQYMVCECCRICTCIGLYIRRCTSAGPWLCADSRMYSDRLPDTCACSKAKGFEVGGNFACDGDGACSEILEVTKVRRGMCSTCRPQGCTHRERHTYKAVLPAGTSVSLSLVQPCTEECKQTARPWDAPLYMEWMDGSMAAHVVA